ncbi:MAG: acetyl-CoA carboxylase carboxyltransferase subunit alpha [Candidatus Latescibacteria bacterium]|jgi:acetyl-CoA carboxylase carboxyl transferase subunit alpha|nr:acetyl-CoA carboxylase carboxyltransferase subunit alpha [Candidatus Latescibacterota bacterium]MBT4137484.1 acetyl-CoA carboxylase carboxyltransferase subunit alpha [Candidatus Latescibacterota bacterium]
MNKTTYLDFEQPILDIDEKIAGLQAQSEAENLDMSDEINALKDKRQKTESDIFTNLTRWQKYQLARHPQRPYSLDYIEHCLTDFVELHGDRFFGDDQAIVAGLAKLDGEPIVVIGQQKGRNTKENLKRNFGLPHPEGYRKALRLMRMAAKFGRPILTLIDTPGAFPGLASEQRSVSEAIAKNLVEMARLPVPIIVAIIGEGASGGALGIGVGDRILMLENAWYSVINPESCSLILWRNRDEKKVAAEAMKIAAEDLIELKVIDRIVPEPFGGAHRNHQEVAQNLKKEILSALREIREIPIEDLTKLRVEKFANMGAWEEV